MTLRERVDTLVQGWVKHWGEDKLFNDPPVFPSGLIQRELLAFAQAVQAEEREALVAMIQDDKGYPRQPQYSALNGWSFIVEAIRARGGKP